MQDIVKYHNNLNKIKLPAFTELEQNLLFTIIARIREWQNNETTKDLDFVMLFPKDLQPFCKDSNLSNREMTEILDSFEKKFFQADFTIIVKDEERQLIGKRKAHLFDEFTIYKEWKTDWNYSYNDIDAWEEFNHIEIEINKNFNYLVNQITSDFTRFELAEFIALSGKYTKTLYRQLKQFRQTGNRIFAWDEFMEIMDIPEDYRQIDIDARILKPAIKELTAERNLFDQKRIPFENLKYTKLDKNKQPNPRGRNKVCFIRFDFKPEKIQELESKPKESKNTHPKEPNINAYCGVNVSIPIREGDKVSRLEGKISDIGYERDKITIAIKDESMRIRNLDFPNLEALEQCIKTYGL